ncbi:MAG TPA: hypothetical protein VJA16_16225 [Thermoanaerobaculia bacterium]
MRRLRRTLLDPASLVSVAAGYAVALSANLLAGLLQPHISIALVIVLDAPAAVVLMLSVPRLLDRASDIGAAPSATFAPARKHRWLIALASPLDGIGSAEAAIRHHLPKLERVFLICSRGDPPNSSSTATRLRDRLVSEGVLTHPEHVQLIVLSPTDFEDLEVVRARIEGIYAERPADIAVGDIVIDITGGRKTTTAGALLAGLPRGRHLEYVSAKELTAAGYALRANEPFEIFVDLKGRGSHR